MIYFLIFVGFQSNDSFFTTNATVLRSSDDIFANNSWVFNQRVHILWGFKPENAEKLSNDSFFTTNATVLRSFDYIFANNFWSFNQRIHISWDFKQGNAEKLPNDSFFITNATVLRSFDEIFADTRDGGLMLTIPH